MNDLNPVVAVALASAIPAKNLKLYKEQIDEGTNAEFDFVATLKGRLQRGEATEATPTAKILNEAILAMLIHRLGVTREHFEKTLFEVAMEAIVHGQPIKDMVIDKDPSLLTIIHAIKKDVVSKLPKDVRAGSIKVLADLDVNRVHVA